MGESLYKIGEVVQVEDRETSEGADGGRIKVRLFSDRSHPSVKDLDWAFPLLPKTIQTAVKVGEFVLVMNVENGNTESQRFYIGPIISQPQYFADCSTYEAATSLLQNNTAKPLRRISSNSDTEGAYPDVSDVALVGRGCEDVIVRNDENKDSSEVTLRAGIRGKAVGDNDVNRKGNIVYNSNDPAYIQAKRQNGYSSEGNSVINLVADTINIMSNKDTDVSALIHDKKELVNSDNADKIRQQLHPVPKGDKLVEFLTLLRNCVLQHVHPWANLPQSGDANGYWKELQAFDINSILSQYTRIS